MRVKVDFKFAEGNEEDTFVIDLTIARKKAKTQLHLDLLDAIDRALLDPDKTADFRTYFDYDFYADIISKGRSSDDYVTIWYW
jgi:hypothetical protein